MGTTNRYALKGSVAQCFQKDVLPILDTIIEVCQEIFTFLGHILYGQSSRPDAIVGIAMEARVFGATESVVLY